MMKTSKTMSRRAVRECGCGSGAAEAGASVVVAVVINSSPAEGEVLLKDTDRQQADAILSRSYDRPNAR
jgi:hypothetical protein